jgi:ankyrin repeat protein
MADLPARPDLDQVRHQARDLLRAAQRGERAALEAIAAVSDRLILASAQLAVARGYGFASWARLKAEIERREILDRGDVDRLTALLARDDRQAVAELEHWCDHPLGAAPLNYVAMLPYDTCRHVWREVPGTGRLARALLAAGAPVDGDPGTRETPLITAASYGNTDVARVLVEAGASLEAAAGADSGGVPGGTALVHAAVFGMTGVVDLLVAAGARIPDLVIAAAAGDLTGWSPAEASAQTRLLALIMAARHERVGVIDELVAHAVPVDDVDPIWGGQAMRVAAEEGRPLAVRALLAHGADPHRRDGDGRTALDRCRSGRVSRPGNAGYQEVEAILSRLGGPPGRLPASEDR